MSPEAVDYMTLAEWSLNEARGILAAGHPEVAAREAYTAALNAARAIIFDKTGKAPKTHSGTRREMHRLIHEGMRFDAGLARFLSDGYEVKSGVDYGPLQAISQSEAEAFVQRATAFLVAARAVIEG